MRRGFSFLLVLALVSATSATVTVTQVGAETPAPTLVHAFPAPGTSHASPGSGISFRGADPAQLGGLTVTGSASGAHPGTLKAQRDGEGTTYTPDAAFTPGETVTVQGVTVEGGDAHGYTFEIAVPAPHPGLQIEPGEFPGTSAGTLAAEGPVTNSAGYTTRPDLVPPAINVTTAADNAAPGLLLATPYTGPTSGGPMIFDNSGEPIWYRPVDGKFSGDLEMQTYQGQPVLVWFEGVQPYGPGNYRGTWKVLDQHYDQIAEIQAGNGMQADIHDIDITADDTAIVQIYNPVTMDLTGEGGQPDAIVLEAVIQEVDIATGDVLFEWHSLDHIPVTDLVTGDITGSIIDYAHPNAQDIDLDGNLLLSLRNTSSVVKIDTITGDVLWHLGGKQNDFTFTDGDPGPSLQHNVRRLPGGDLTIFDNGNGHTPAESRGVRYTLNETTKVATFVKQQKHTPALFAPTQGDYQTFDDGGQLISWGGLGNLTEYTSGGTVRFEATIPGGTYRTFREDWHGTPSAPPDVVVTKGSPSDTVAVSWNGATDVTDWDVYAGDRAGKLVKVATSPKTGFETTIQIPAGSVLVQVKAKDSGTIIGNSLNIPVRPYFDEAGAPAVNGTYKPLTGNFTGDEFGDIVWYAPGAAADHLWTNSGVAFSSQVLPSVSGDYQPLVGDFAGDTHDDILWRTPGSTRAYLWTSQGDGTFVSTTRTVPAANQAKVLPNENTNDEVLWYTPGPGGDAITWFGPTAGSRAINVNGTYQPLVGDYDGNGTADIVWYAPGTAADSVWWSTGTSGHTTGQVVTATTINGSYAPLVGHFSDDFDLRADIEFYSPGNSTSGDSLWEGEVGRTFTKRTRNSSEGGVATLINDGQRDHVVLLNTGADAVIWTPGAAGADTYRNAGNTPFPAGAQVLVENFAGALGGDDDLFWYRPGTAPELVLTPRP